jgi:hypothetical protein
MDAPMMKSMSDLQMMLMKCMAQCMETECKVVPGMMSACTESRMKTALCDLQMMIPRCMSECMNVQCTGHKMPMN